MKTEDIDKRIGMPDVDAEWTKFEREVIGNSPAGGKPKAKQKSMWINPNRSLEIFLCKKSDYSRLCHRYSICMLTQYADFALFQDKMKANFSNDRFRLNLLLTVKL